MQRRLVRGVTVGAVAAGAAVFVAEALRPRGGPARLVDWDEIHLLAGRRLGDAESLGVRRRRALATAYERLAGEVKEPLLEAVGGLPDGVPLPAFQALDRQGWLDLNVGIMRRMLAPLEDLPGIPASLVTDWTRGALDRWVAGLFGFLSRRVLGQFDPQLLGREPVRPGLYLVETNVAAFERKEKLPAEDLRRWLILHELTHAWQFAAHPWLAEYMNEEVGHLLSAAGAAGRGLDRLAAVTLGVPAQWEAVRRLQALMTVVEGYGNLIMNRVGRELLPGFAELEAAHRRRNAERGPLDLLLWKLLGLELKLQQYQVGEAFCQAIADAHGMSVLNLVWESPSAMPRSDELRHPERWHSRVVAATG
ncbi:MAG: zinc-dependent metalloprotease [Candidatus Dormibacteraeota bacterium]|nr:zinc-dependent metalloprotease [Candidatus Dormibacteraeota bacterium]